MTGEPAPDVLPVPPVTADPVSRCPVSRCPVCLTWHGSDEPHERMSLFSMVVGYWAGLVALAFVTLVLAYGLWALTFGLLWGEGPVRLLAVPCVAAVVALFVGYARIVSAGTGAARRIDRLPRGRLRWILAATIACTLLPPVLAVWTHTPWALLTVFAPGLLLRGPRTLLAVPALCLLLVATAYLLEFLG
ncbi:hypothetical protein [Actinocorallia longicatena]|uniref:Tripartite tricarboxylate transporter TctB family protein n=1 Tax=Actinocorallia longicatena TaxID=111803 RepID=A0ABP6QN43_9ACTN